MRQTTRTFPRPCAWLLACLLLAGAVVAHDVAMASMGHHVVPVAREVTCEPGPLPGHQDHGHTHIEETDPGALPADCEAARAVAPIKRTIDPGEALQPSLVLPGPATSPAPVANPPLDGADWLVRDPHAQRALWQVYRI